jgi:ribonuclease P protein component
MLPSPSRLRRSDDIARVRQQGRRWPHPLLVLFVHRQPTDSPAATRFAFAVGRHIGPAAQRNRVKRRLREIVRRRLDRLHPGYDCLFVARPGIQSTGNVELEQALVQLLSRGGVLINDAAESSPRGSRS